MSAPPAAPQRLRFRHMDEFVWEPSAEVLEHANVVRLMRRHGIDDYWELVRRAQDDPEWFWPAAVDDMGLEFSQPWTRVVDTSRGPEWATWFVGGKLNLAWNCVHRWAERRADATAAVSVGENGDHWHLTWAELSDEVTRLAEALDALGIRSGDRVATYLPMHWRAAAASHACAHVGAVQVPIFSGFSAPAVAARLKDAGAKALVTADGTLRRGREVLMKAVADQALDDAPSVEHVVVWRRLDSDVAMRPGRDHDWEEVVEKQPGTLEPLEVDSEHPYLLTYTSGTTGRPKGVVHVQGGFLVSIAREAAYQADLHPDDVLHFATTGEPWNPDPYMWLYERVGGGRAPIINISGGTEVGACFLSPSVAIPIKSCSLGGPALGMAMDVVDAEGKPVRGEVGELVCRKPFPGMTRGFWRDPDRYLDTYWRRFPGVWVHGDWASVDEDGYWFLHGRSDDTLNIAGKRIGPAEIESAVVGHPAVSEAAAIGVPHELKGEVAWVFCVLAPGHEAGDDLAADVADEAARELGKAFRPDRVVFVTALPKTRSAKIVRRAVRAKALGADPGDLSSLENPESLEEIARAV